MENGVIWRVPAVSAVKEGFAVLHKMTGEQFAYIHGETELLLHCAPEG